MVLSCRKGLSVGAERRSVTTAMCAVEPQMGKHLPVGQMGKFGRKQRKSVWTLATLICSSDMNHWGFTHAVSTGLPSYQPLPFATSLRSLPPCSRVETLQSHHFYCIRTTGMESCQRR